MQFWFTQFAQAEEPASGLGALGLDVKAFLFQLITFVIVLVVLRKYVFSRLVATLEKRRLTLEQSLEQAKATEIALSEAQNTADKILKEARTKADATLSEAQSKAREVITEAEAGGAQKAERILQEAKDQLGLEKERLRQELKGELAELVVEVTEKVIKKKLSSTDDHKLIAEGIKELSR